MTSPNPSNADIREHRKAFKDMKGHEIYFRSSTGDLIEEQIKPIREGMCVVTDAFYPVYGRKSGYLGFKYGKEFEKVSL